jgi:CheY-like chemotaxis protein
MDLNMPVMDGFEATQQILNLNKISHIDIRAKSPSQTPPAAGSGESSQTMALQNMLTSQKR